MEVVGTCSTCGKTIYCDAGFVQGVHEDGQLLCFDCYEQQKTPAQ